MSRKNSLFTNIAVVLIVLAGAFRGQQCACAQEEVPRIIGVSPQFGAADVDTGVDIAVSFSTAMDKKSVEKSFRIFPEINGSFRWKENTLVFKPERPLLPSTAYFVSFIPDMKSTSGIPLVVMYFTTPAQAVCVGPGGSLTLVSIKGEEKNLEVAGNNPVWTADNQHILYDYQGKVWMVGTNGKNAAALTADGESYGASTPVNNPQGDLVAFVGTDAAGIANVYSLEMKTEAVRQLTAFFEPGTVEYVQWSPDGLYLAFLRGGQVWIMNQDGTNMRKLTTTDLPCKANFAWSPGGTKIAFSGKENIWIGDVYSGELRKVSFENPKTGMLAWALNNKLCFEAEGITIMDADGSSEVQIATSGRGPMWVDRGTLFSFVLPLHNAENTAQLWMMSADGLKKEKLAVIDNRNRSVSWSGNANLSRSLFP